MIVTCTVINIFRTPVFESIQWVKIGFTDSTVCSRIKPVRTFANERVILHRTHALVAKIRRAFELTIVTKKSWLTKITTSSVKVPRTCATSIRAGAVPTTCEVRITAAIV